MASEDQPVRSTTSGIGRAKGRRPAATKPGGVQPEVLLKEAQVALDDDRFSEARQLYERVARNPAYPADVRRKGRQGWARCTYKDADLPTAFRLRHALRVLDPDGESAATEDQETLRLAGWIYRLLWRHEARKENLERSLAYYLRGHSVGPEHDAGYTSICSAFVLDELAFIEEEVALGASSTSSVARDRRSEARRIRTAVITEVEPRLEDANATWWFFAAVAEAHFGLGQYEAAGDTIVQGLAKLTVADRQQRSTAEQLAALARNQGLSSTQEFETSPAARVIGKLVGDRNEKAVVESVHIGKVGIALSGGGFRASLYHLGVLAKLAELDVLRRVEVLSCVSGGSILGAHYYLAARTLLEAKGDDEIGRDDYIALIQWLEREFTAGVEKNVRTRVAGSWTTNLRMIFGKDYSRTLRVGELYEKHLYSGIPKDGDPEGQREWLDELQVLKAKSGPENSGPGIRRRARATQRALNGLFVHPKGEDRSFKPRKDNWRRNNKVPDLILNATSLNTGHCWQFTASWMGEPPTSVEGQIDGNDWLRRMYYHECPAKHRTVRLGDAVAASSCVPGLFEPLAFKDLFPDRTVRLVDGGVHDNQGIVGLFDQDCRVVLVSDASGQMGTVADPSPGFVGVPLRANGILMNRVRTEEFKTLVARSKAGLLRGMMFIHLREGLTAEPVDWVGCDDEASVDLFHDAMTPVVNPGVQALVSELRTDLDSFSEVEAFALMTLGYRMTERVFAQGGQLAPFPTEAGPERPTWRFLQSEEDMNKPPHATLLGRHLEVGSSKAFRAWRLSRPLQGLAVALGVVLSAAAGWTVWRYWDQTLLSVGMIGSLLLGLLATAVVGKQAVKVVNLRASFQRVGLGILFATAGWVAACLHIGLSDRLFLAAGRAKKVIGRPHPRASS